MANHINFMGYSLWTSDTTLQESDQERAVAKPLYSPTVLAAYSIVFNLFIGIILYGINITRRGYRWRGIILIALSGLTLAASALVPVSDLLITAQQSKFPLNGLVGLSLYAVEKPHFRRAIRHGGKQARWWLPLVWIGVFAGVVWWLGMFLG
jgi:hypothetical protein